MKKLLIGVSLSGVTKETVSVVMNVADDYTPILDAPNVGNPFPELRKAIYEDMKKSPGKSYDEAERYKPINTRVIAITDLGPVDEATDEQTKYESALKAADIMGGK